jgi:hypothetical protein
MIPSQTCRVLFDVQFNEAVGTFLLCWSNHGLLTR